MCPQLPRSGAPGRRTACGEAKIGAAMADGIGDCGGTLDRAVVGGLIEVDRLPVEVGESVDIEDVLLIRDGDEITIGTPLVQGARVETKVEDQVKGPKIVVFKYKPKNRYRVKSGHRQHYTRLRVETIKKK